MFKLALAFAAGYFIGKNPAAQQTTMNAGTQLWNGSVQPLLGGGVVSAGQQYNPISGSAPCTCFTRGDPGYSVPCPPGVACGTVIG